MLDACRISVPFCGSAGRDARTRTRGRKDKGRRLSFGYMSVDGMAAVYENMS